MQTEKWPAMRDKVVDMRLNKGVHNNFVLSSACLVNMRVKPFSGSQLN